MCKGYNLEIRAKVQYTDGFIKGFKCGQQITKTVAQHDVIVAMAFFIFGSAIAILLRAV